MGNFVNWISLEVLRTLGWTLLHFLWQGAGLAALFAVATAVYRSAPARYALAVSALVLMMASPVITFLWLGAQSNPAVRTGAEGASTWAGRSTRNATALSGSRALAAESRTVQPMAMLWLVEAWFLGVLLLSLRTAGGLFVIERMRRKEIKPVGRERYERCLALQRRMGLDRVIRYCECHRLDAPAVLGWFHPVVLLPVRALTGLTEEQIEARLRSVSSGWSDGMELPAEFAWRDWRPVSSVSWEHCWLATHFWESRMLRWEPARLRSRGKEVAA